LSEYLHNMSSKTSESSKPRITFTLGEFDERVIEKMAKKRDVSKSEIVRNLIHNWIEDNHDILKNNYEIDFKEITEELQQDSSKEIMNKITDDNKLNIIQVIDEILPSDARNILGNGYLTITGRMHASISTLQMKKPAIPLSYSLKYDGLIGEMMDLKELVIKSNISDIWVNKEIVDTILERVEYIVEHYEELVSKINNSLSKNTALVNNAVNEIMGKIEGEVYGHS